MLELIITFTIYYIIFSGIGTILSLLMNFIGNRYLDRVSDNLRAATLEARGW